MKKILLVVDGVHFSLNTLEFLRGLNEREPLMATGAFVPQLDYANLWTYAAAASAGAVYMPLVEEEDDNVEKNIARFEQYCLRAGIRYRVHKDFYDFALPELKRESRFADAMVLNGELFYRQLISASQFDYMQTALHQSECPVLIVPEEVQFPTTNILAYDGTEESVYALKQFAYLFPELAKNKTLLVYAEEKDRNDFPARDYIVELATQHYPDLTFYKLEYDPGRSFPAWIADQRKSLLISGSFGRSVLSTVIRKSFVAHIIKEHRVPVFIAHRS